jgi:hypothetical protein
MYGYASEGSMLGLLRSLLAPLYCFRTLVLFIKRPILLVSSHISHWHVGENIVYRMGAGMVTPRQMRSGAQEEGKQDDAFRLVNCP